MLHELPFFREVLDRCERLRGNEEQLAEAWAAQGSRVIPVRKDGSVPVTPEGKLAFREGWRDGVADQATLLGRDASGHYFWSMPDDGSASERDYVSLRLLPASLTPEEAAIACAAVAYEHWHQSSLYCTSCGAETARSLGGSLRSCPVCRAEHFPRTDPAVIMLVTDGDRCVLGQRQGAPAARWSPLAGFVEPGESAETAVRREIREESGLEVDRIEYVISQPWPFPRSLMLGFRVYVHPHRAKEIVLNEEHRVLEWIERRTLRTEVERGTMELPPPVSVASHLIRSWMDEPDGDIR